MNWLFRLFAVKPIAGAIVALVVGDFLAENQSGIPAIMPELVSLILLVLAFRCRGKLLLSHSLRAERYRAVGRPVRGGPWLTYVPNDLLLSRCWSWILLLASAAFSNRALRDADIWTPEIGWLVAIPISYLVVSGAFRELLTSWSPLIRWCAVGLLLSVAGTVPFIWDRYPSYAFVVVVMIHGGILLSAFAGAKVFNLKGSHA